MGHQFTRAVRLTKNWEFSKVFGASQKIRGRWVTIFYCANTIGHARLGIIIPKKNVKFAHERNRLKRLVREYFRRRQQQLTALDLVFFIYKGAQLASTVAIWQHLEEQLIKLGALRTKE